jgi:hypothetical protein
MRRPLEELNQPVTEEELCTNMTTTMLCGLCENIELQVDAPIADINIRSYRNLQELQESASRCDFCHILYREAQKIEHPDEGTYCKQMWGAEFFDKLLAQTPVEVQHRASEGEHNVALSLSLDALNTVGYLGGPKKYIFSGFLGGIFVKPGKLIDLSFSEVMFSRDRLMDSDSAAAGVVAGRPFSVNTPKDEVIRLARTKIDECRLAHGECAASLDQAFMPKRVLDLYGLSRGEERICLIVSPLGFRERYATLSYCWGSGPNLQLTTLCLRDYTDEGIPISQLPGTIRDACELCLGIGIRYLWVCSLCIVQDSEHDWIEQSSVMGTIYNCSDVTISAAKSKSCTAGLFDGETQRSSHC